MTPAEMMQNSTIPPFKVYFNIDLRNQETGSRNKTGRKVNVKKKALRLTEPIFNIILSAFDKAARIQKGE